jgi:predicted HAD superfamily Cof-like phosphohydrolase
MFMPPRPADLVREFHAAFGLGIGGRPAEIAPVLAAHRQDLLDEEVAEASRGGHLDELAHELADVVYTVYGTARSGMSPSSRMAVRTGED